MPAPAVSNTDRTSGGVLSTLRWLWSHIPPHRKRHFLLLLGPMILAALSETVSLGLLLPFLALLADPDKMFAVPAVVSAARMLGAETAAELLPVIAGLFAAAVAGSALLRLTVSWASSRFAFGVGEDLGVEVFRRTLYQPYQKHVARNSSTVLGALVKIKATSLSLVTATTMLSSALIAVSLIIGLMIIQPFVATAAFVGFGGLYLSIMLLARHRLARNSRVEAAMITSGMKTVQEGLGGIRDVILDSNQPFFTKTYRAATHAQARSQANSYFVSHSPRYVVEGIGMVLVIAVAYFAAGRPGGFAAALPILGAFALGAQRLMPVMQAFYAGWAVLKANQSALTNILEFLDQPIGREFDEALPAPRGLDHDLVFDNVGFNYQADSAPVLKGLSFHVAKGQRVGVLGSTGSGKSTTFDLLMGLLEPTEGAILIDGVPLEAGNRRAWQRTIAHVPQAIFLSDATLAENIAFGVPLKDIDMDRVRDAARKAQIADFVEAEPQGYLVRVGERGVRLSGGQRQRIGIARALYKNASVLVFDEATSALDNATEQSVMQAVEGLGRDLTIFMIAHRLTTLSGCDVVLELEQGRLAAMGSYREIVSNRQRLSA